MVPQTDASSVQPHGNLVRGKSRGYSQPHSARHQPGLAALFPAVLPPTGAALLQVSENWAVMLPTSPSTYQVPKPRWGWAWCAPPGYYISLPSTGCVCQVPPSEAVSDPSFAGNIRMFHSSMENTQLGQAQLQFFSILLKRKYTHLSLAEWSNEPRARLLQHVYTSVCAKKRKHISVRSVFLTWGA